MLLCSGSLDAPGCFSLGLSVSLRREEGKVLRDSGESVVSGTLPQLAHLVPLPTHCLSLGCGSAMWYPSQQVSLRDLSPCSLIPPCPRELSMVQHSEKQQVEPSGPWSPASSLMWGAGRAWASALDSVLHLVITLLFLTHVFCLQHHAPPSLLPAIPSVTCPHHSPSPVCAPLHLSPAPSTFSPSWLEASTGEGSVLPTLCPAALASTHLCSCPSQCTSFPPRLPRPALLLLLLLQALTPS